MINEKQIGKVYFNSCKNEIIDGHEMTCNIPKRYSIIKLDTNISENVVSSSHTYQDVGIRMCEELHLELEKTCSDSICFLYDKEDDWVWIPDTYYIDPEDL